TAFESGLEDPADTKRARDGADRLPRKAPAGRGRELDVDREDRETEQRLRPAHGRGSDQPGEQLLIAARVQGHASVVRDGAARAIRGSSAFALFTYLDGGVVRDRCDIAEFDQ